MNIKHNIVLFLFFLGCIFSTEIRSQEHPILILTQQGVESIRKELGSVPVFDATLQRVQQEVDAVIALGIDTPTPKDYSGGYTHEKHKQNYLNMQKAGLLFQILNDEKYAVYVRDMLFQYEAMYKDLPLHPQTRSYARGKLFWQCLNDSNWLVYTSQAYDCIYNWLSKKERRKLEKNLFKPFADFISIENPQFFNRVHNHSTWGNAAVGMIGLVMNDDELVDRALYGIKNDGLSPDARDNDGGFIKKEGQKAGFLANIDEPFSPDGYYTEGPYYQRYAMYPFLAFAQALQNAKPSLKIFEHKNGVLLKSVDALLNLTDASGNFFPLNDGQKGMSYYSRELVNAINTAYYFGDKNPALLGISKKQNRVLLSDAGLAVALAIRDGKNKEFAKKSILFSDGMDGKQGGVGVLRYGGEDITVVFKYAAQGLSHGHYDKLSFSMYAKGDEIIQDYGLARFVNIEQKGGGNYLKENKTWAKQSIAHNTVIQNRASHFKGKYKIGSQHHSELLFADIQNEDFQILSAKEENAYAGTKMQRTQAIIKLKDLKPFVLDVMKVTAEKENEYDFPFYYLGQIINTNFSYQTPKNLQALGEKNGYQHLWLEGRGKASKETHQFTFLNKQTFYTISSANQLEDELLLTRIGANDPEFNLRRDPGFMIRRKAKNTVFASIIEPHGGYSYVSEFSKGANSNIAEVAVVYDDKYYTAVSIKTVKGVVGLLIIANNSRDTTKKHSVKIKDKKYSWKGVYHYQQTKK